MKKSLIAIVISVIFVFVGCGDPLIELTDVEYKPKIVVEGYIYPGEKVANIKIMRNIPLDKTMDSLFLFITDAEVYINKVRLQFNPLTYSYYTDSIIAQFNTSYTIEVTAKIDGVSLFTKSTTTTPSGNLSIFDKTLGDKRYIIDPVEVSFKPVTGSDIYAMSIIPLEANLDNFIYDNPFLPNVKRADLEKDFNNFRYQLVILADINKSAADTINYTLKGYDMWFYSEYRMIVYAGDRNLRNYLLTAKNVQEFDGNFHEPILHFQGDGIGVFASVVKDTVTFKITK